MAFIRTDFSPVGSQGRAGVVPQVFSYTTPDNLAAVKASAYFPLENGVSDKNGMLGVFSTNDIIHVVTETGGTAAFAIIFILNDGSDGNAITTNTLDINAA